MSYIDTVELYKGYLKELQEELDDEILNFDSVIQILRNDTPNIESNYYSIIDWCYSDEEEQKLYKIDPFDFEDEIEQKNMLKTEYELDKPDLEQITVKEFINELTLMINIYSKQTIS